MKHITFTFSENDFLRANRRAARQEEIEAFGHPITFRSAKHKSMKAYDRNREKRSIYDSLCIA